MINKAYAVIAGAGSGSRMGGVSKPNIKILGKTLFEYVLEAFDESCVCGVNVVCSEDN
ncbi:MAG: NTP transferase domain-containing protein, partial [Clostridia bacterium]|nr:NTP transferase domain-containing protein [Clostridia bacterium]